MKTTMKLLDIIEMLYKARKELAGLHASNPFEASLFDSAIQHIDKAIHEVRIQLKRETQP